MCDMKKKKREEEEEPDKTVGYRYNLYLTWDLYISLNDFQEFDSPPTILSTPFFFPPIVGQITDLHFHFLFSCMKINLHELASLSGILSSSNLIYKNRY